MCSALATALVAALICADGPTVSASGAVTVRGGYNANWDASDPSAPATATLFGTPRRTLLVEANVLLRIAPLPNYELVTDLSLFANAEVSSNGRAGKVPPTGNLVVPSELYANLGFSEHLHGLVGRKRLVWGSGLAWNPTDLLNPAKDPTDPTSQRTGAWMARLEAPFERVTGTLLWAPAVTVSEAGLPRRFLTRPGEKLAEQLVAARLYALIANADLNFMWFWSNAYADSIKHSQRLGASFSRYFFDAYELHVEALGQLGRDTLIFAPECLPQSAADPTPLLVCASGGRNLVSRPFKNDERAYVQLVAGTRYTFPDDSLLSFEYYFNGTGLTRAQFRARRTFAARLPNALEAQSGLPPDAAALVPNPQQIFLADTRGAPARFSFQPLRRHYVFIVYDKPRVLDDFRVSATLICGLEDWSALAAPAVSYEVRQWFVFALRGYVPLGGRGSEFGGLPFRGRVMAEATASY